MWFLLRMNRHERPWALCAVFLVFVLVSLYNAKNEAQWYNSSLSTHTDNVQFKSSFWGGTLVAPVGSVEEQHHRPENTIEDDEAAAAAAAALRVETNTHTTHNTNHSTWTTPPSTDFNFCTAPALVLPNAAGNYNTTMELLYPCDGPRYRSFMAGLYAFCDDLVTAGEQPTSWGHRTTLPPNQRYLFLGNSHTRQLAMAVLCQTKVHVVQVQTLDGRNAARARRYTLDNGSELYLVVNSDVVHSPAWQQLLGIQIGVNLTEFDAVVLGVFNTCEGADANTTFAQEMIAAQDLERDIDCTTTHGPSLADVAAVYHGPLVFVSMFASYRSHTYLVDLTTAQHLRTEQNRTNVLGIEARHYIKDYHLAECGSALRNNVSDCHTDEEEARRYQHRCVGPYGGHPDLIAWDVLEFLYQHA